MKRLLLVGGGHAHVEVLRHLSIRPVPGWETILVSREERAVYSGLVPAFAAGQIAEEEIGIDLQALAERAGARFLRARVSAVDAEGRRASLDDDDAIDYDLASLDVGASVAGRGLEGVAEHALASRPIDGLVAGIASRIEALRSAADGSCRLCVVGSGAAGIELAFCLDARLQREGSRKVETTLVDGGRAVLPGASRALSARVGGALRRRRIATRLGREVVAVEADGIRLDDDAKLPAEIVIWATGPEAHPLARDSALPIDARGFVRIRPSFEVEGHDSLFAAGDCASLPGMGRAGVYAVRAGPVLSDNLRTRMRGDPTAALRRYSPQGDFLSLLNLGDGRAIGAKWGIAVEGRWVMRLKDRIDRGFVARYR